MTDLKKLEADVELLKKHAHVHDIITPDDHASICVDLSGPPEAVPDDYLYARTPGGKNGLTCEGTIEKIIKEKAKTDDYDIFALHAAIAIIEEIRKYPRKYIGNDIDAIEDEWRKMVNSLMAESAAFTDKYNTVCSESVDLRKELDKFKRYYTELTSQNESLCTENEALENELHNTKCALETVRNDRNKLIDAEKAAAQPGLRVDFNVLLRERDTLKKQLAAIRSERDKLINEENADSRALCCALNEIAHRSNVCSNYDRAEACQKIARDALRNRYKG